MQLVLNPRRFDVMLTENMFGDILSDEGSGAGRLDRHAAFGVARRIEGIVRAGARLGARISPDRTRPIRWAPSAPRRRCSNTVRTDEGSCSRERRDRQGARIGPRHGGFETERHAGDHSKKSATSSERSIMNKRPRTIIEKIWDSHVVAEQRRARPRCSTSTCTWSTKSLRRRLSTDCAQRGLKVRRPDLTIATTDHSTPTTPRGLPDSR